MLVAAVDGVGQDGSGRLAQHVLLGHAADLLRHRQRAHQLDDVMIEERHAAFDRVRHLHAVAEHGQHVVRQLRLGPQIERLVHRRPAAQLAAHVETVQERAVGIVLADRRQEIVGEQRAQLERRGAERLEPRRREAEEPLNARQRQRLPVRQQQAARDRIGVVQLVEQPRRRSPDPGPRCRTAACRGGSAGSRRGSRRSLRR